MSSVARIFQKTRIMRKDSRISNYIHRQFMDRLRAISEFDYNLRQDKSYQTRIKMGVQDLELHKKVRFSNRWEKVTLPKDLPPVNMSSRTVIAVSESPPPGRPGRDIDNGGELNYSDAVKKSNKVPETYNGVEFDSDTSVKK